MGQGFVSRAKFARKVVKSLSCVDFRLTVREVVVVMMVRLAMVLWLAALTVFFFCLKSHVDIFVLSF